MYSLPGKICFLGDLSYWTINENNVFSVHRVCKTCGFRMESGLRPPVHRVYVGLDFTALPCPYGLFTAVAVANITIISRHSKKTVYPTLDIRMNSSPNKFYATHMGSKKCSKTTLPYHNIKNINIPLLL